MKSKTNSIYTTYPQQVIEYTNKNGVTKELRESLLSLWLINSALSEDVITSPPKDNIVQAYIDKWVVDETDYIYFYNEVVKVHFTEEQFN